MTPRTALVRISITAALAFCAAACDDASITSSTRSRDDRGGASADAGALLGESDADTTNGDAASDGEDTWGPPEGPWLPCSDDDEVGAHVVRAHDKAAQFFSGWDPGQNTRLVDAEADFPEQGRYERVYLKVELACPDGGSCDAWDRAASLALVEGEGANEKLIELARHMTPYGVGMCFVIDVSELSTRLSGKKKVRSFIDTWVGPGHPQGDGWQVTSTFLFRKGASAEPVSEVVPLWNNQAEDRLVDLGDPTKPVTAELPARTVNIPADAKQVKLRYLVTGHGQGNLDNCAEFCLLKYTTQVGDNAVQLEPWRDDCDKNPLNAQFGTWRFPRAGWCPGAVVLPELVDITELVTPGEEKAFGFDVLDASGAPFVNSCRPMAGDENNRCEGCVSGAANNCDYNNNGHTPPHARVSVQLLIYR